MFTHHFLHHDPRPRHGIPSKSMGSDYHGLNGYKFSDSEGSQSRHQRLCRLAFQYHLEAID